MTAAQSELTYHNGEKYTTPTSLFINGEFVNSTGDRKWTIYNPATAQPLAEVQSASEEDVDKAVKAARQAFKSTWGKKITGQERSRLMHKLADLIERDSEVLAKLESANTGKGIRICREMDVADTVACLRYYAGWADKTTGKVIDVDDTQRLVYTRSEPIGVVGQIIPWNYPLLMMAWKISPALAAGCTILLKPSEHTPLTALHLAKLSMEAGLPAGVFNVLPGDGSTGSAIARHGDVNKVAFTGSTVTGKKVWNMCGEGLKRCALELGGKSPSIVFPSANLEQAAAWTCLGIYFNSGQDCTAGSRIAVHESVYDEFVKLLKSKAADTAIGLPHEQHTSFGPLISKGQFDKVLNYVKQGKEDQASVITGGDAAKVGNGEGWYVQPTIFGDVKPGMKIHDEEIFGPVLCVRKFTDEDEVIEWANSLPYGLGASIHTNDAKQTIRVSNAIDAGTIWINSNNYNHIQAPFGGFKQSGIGRELGEEGLASYQETKTVMHHIGDDFSWPL